jgi:uncharacterized protein YdaU (DUF1376 family)
VNYYKRHIGDYAKKAGHLSALEHGVYTLILDAYYDREQAPTEVEAMRWARARNPDETQAVATCLAEFFILRDGRYFQQRVEDELESARVVAERNRTNGKLGGRRPRDRKTQSLKSGLPKQRQSTNPLIQEKDKELEVLPDWLPPEKWQDFVEHRKDIKAAMTDKARERMLRHLADLQAKGHDVLALMNTAIRSGWKDVYEPKPAGQFNSPIVPAVNKPGGGRRAL